MRQQIREAFKARLTGLTTTGANVVTSKLHPYLQEDADLPGLAIWTDIETIRANEEDTEQGTQHRTLSVVVEGVAGKTATKSVDDILDDIAEEVETAIYTDPLFNRLIIDCVLEQTESDLSGETKINVGIITMTFRVEYLTREGSPDEKA